MSRGPCSDRRRFLGSVATVLAAAPFAWPRAEAQSASSPSPAASATMKTDGALASLKQINAGVLSVAYAAGYRVIVPYLRGYGSTVFLSSATLRNGDAGGPGSRHR